MAFLAGEGFRFDRESTSNDFAVLDFQKFDCRIKVVEASPSGWHEDLIQRLSSAGDRVAFFFDGKVWDRQPRWRSWSYKHWRNANRLIGRSMPYRPTFGVVTPASCPLDDAGWAALSAS